jgi:hypothetical protein
VIGVGSKDCIVKRDRGGNFSGVFAKTFQHGVQTETEGIPLVYPLDKSSYVSEFGTPSLEAPRHDRLYGWQSHERWPCNLYLTVEPSPQRRLWCQSVVSRYKTKCEERREIAEAGLWHQRLGHPGPAVVEHLCNSSRGVRIKGPTTAQCDACGIAKIHRQIRRTPRREDKDPLRPAERLAFDFHVAEYEIPFGVLQGLISVFHVRLPLIILLKRVASTSDSSFSFKNETKKSTDLNRRPQNPPNIARSPIGRFLAAMSWTTSAETVM